MPENTPNPIAELIRRANERLSQELKAQAAELEKLGESLPALRSRQQQLEEAVGQQLEMIATAVAAAPSSAPLDKVLGSVRNLITATLPEQVFATLTEEAEQMGVRAAVFDIRGKAAWGAAARGFGAELSEKAFRALVVPLNKDNAFRQVYETGGHVDATVELLKKSRNVFDKFKPNPGEPIFLLPVRSAGSVSAIFYADTGGKARTLPDDALKIIAEFAGAQLDRLMVLSGGLPPAATEKPDADAAAMAVAVEEREALAAATQVAVEEKAPSRGAVESPAGAPPGAVRSPEPAVSPAALSSAQPAGQAATPSGGPSEDANLSKMSEADQKVHKDAKRFAKLLISEIDLYNKAKVADGRKSRDLYKRLKTDIDRSRQTYEKRFGKSVAKQVDYFHDELVRTLAANEASLLGSDYPGPSV